MPNRLLALPWQRLQTEIRLPLIQHPTEAIVENLHGTLANSDALRRVKTTRGASRIALGPLPAVQKFVVSGPGGPNTPESMATGLRARNAPRVADKTRGQSAGVA